MQLFVNTFSENKKNHFSIPSPHPPITPTPQHPNISSKLLARGLQNCHSLVYTIIKLKEKKKDDSKDRFSRSSTYPITTNYKLTKSKKETRGLRWI
jgi:hypothetical protein